MLFISNYSFSKQPWVMNMLFNQKRLMLTSLSEQIKSCLFFILLLLPTFANAINVYAHRGGRAIWPENTLTAFKGALDLQVDFIDMDINLSKDNTFMVTHDLGLNPLLTRDKNNQWIKNSPLIKNLSESAIKSYNVGKIKKHTPYAREFLYQKPSHIEHIPSLIEAIHFVKKYQKKPTKFQIEVKTNEDKDIPSKIKYAKTLYRVLKKEKIANKTEVQSFDYEVLKALYHLDKRLKLAYLMELSKKPKKISKTAYVLPFLKEIKRQGGSLWEPEFSLLNKKLVKSAHDLGLKVVVWGFSNNYYLEKNQIKKAVYYGVDGIITDNPKLQPWIKSLKT